MSQAAKVQEPSMEEILASIRRIIADDDTGKTKPAEPPVLVKSAPPRAQPDQPAAANSQGNIDAMLAEINAKSKAAPTMPPAEAVSAASAPPPATAAADVFEITEGASVPPAPSPAPEFHTIDPASDLVFTDKAAPAIEPPRSFSEERRAFAPLSGPTNAPDRALLSNAAEAAVDNAFTSLANTVLGPHMRTLEDLVQEMLRPMLKGWLDNNLPSLVERIVRDEIERVARGRH